MTRSFLFCLLLATTAAIADDAPADGRFERTVSVSGPVELDAATDSGGIIVTKGQAGSVHIRGILKAHNGRNRSDAEARIQRLMQNPPIEQSGNVIRVGHVKDKDLLRAVSMRLEISVPAETRLRAKADSGGIRVSGIRGPVECHTDSGGIEATGIGSDVRASVDSGGIRIRNVRGQVVATADSGGIEAIDIGGPIEVSSDSGGVRVAQNNPAPVRVRADSGGAEIRLAQAGGYDVNASSSSGRVTVADIALRGEVNPHHVQGKVRGGGPLVAVEVGSGDVNIR